MPPKKEDEGDKFDHFANLVQNCPLRENGGGCANSYGQKCVNRVKTAKHLLRSENYEADFSCLPYVQTCTDMNLKKEATGASVLGLEAF